MVESAFLGAEEVTLVERIDYIRSIINYIYATFTLNGFDNQERNLTFVKTAF